MNTSPPFTGNILIDTVIALIMFVAGVWIYLGNRNKLGAVIVIVTLIWAWLLYARYF